MIEYRKVERQNMKLHPEMNEKWLQSIIASDPSILGLGDLELRDKERIQPSGGKLDLLLQHTETKRRYEVEIQLGPTDPSHIIRTLEYWDIERKRYPQYEHCAVIVAESITSRFLNVISLFNGAIPLIAIQMQAIKNDGVYSLIFTTVLDQLTLGFVDEDESVVSAQADRTYWEERASKATLKVADKVCEIAKTLNPVLALNYNKPYIGFVQGTKSFNFVTISPRKKFAWVEIKIPQSDDIDTRISNAGLDFDVRNNTYNLQVTAQDIDQHKDLFQDLIQLSYEARIT